MGRDYPTVPSADPAPEKKPGSTICAAGQGWVSKKEAATALFKRISGFLILKFSIHKRKQLLNLVRLEGLEPPTYCLEGHSSVG
ncbi:MAG: hypothetical protein KUL80_10680 [Comamonas sp.]|nr:hypothetical protein [Comamonas sp.]